MVEELTADEMSQLGLISVGGEVMLHRPAKVGKLDRVPARYMTKENLMRKGYSFDNDNVFHMAARYGHLDQIPVRFLTMENLMIPNGDGYTAVEVAALACHLDQIPVLELTPEKLELGSGNRVLHFAATAECLHQLPKLLLAEEFLCEFQAANGVKMNTLELARAKGCLDQLLGVELSEAARKFVGADWWEKNQAVLLARKELDTAGDSVEVELF